MEFCQMSPTLQIQTANSGSRVLMIAPSPFFADRGCHVRILNAYLRLKKQGDDVTLLTYPIGRDIDGVKIIRIASLPNYKKTSVGFSWYRPLLDLLLLIKAMGEMRRNSYDYIYGHLHEGAIIGEILRFLFKIPVIFDSQGSLVSEMQSHSGLKKGGGISAVLGRVEKIITEHADEIITSSHELANYIRTNFSFNGTLTTIKDFPDCSIYNQQVEPADIRLPEGRQIAAYLGGLQPYKGIEYLLRAIPHVDQRYHFLIMGHPPEIWMQLVSDLGIGGRVTFTGSVKYEEAPRYLKLARIGLAPKTLESGETNGKIYQYAAMGLPTVCFDIPENREILSGAGMKGYFAKEKNIEDFAQKINQTLLSEP